MHDDAVVNDFTKQSEAFDCAPVTSAAETLGALVELVPQGGGGRWLDAACGTGIVARALAERADDVLGVDLTMAMLDVGRRETRSAGLANVRFELGDATGLQLPDASFDGAVTRFSLHHVPAPGRVIAELARIVRPGGWVIIGDHVTDEDAAAPRGTRRSSAYVTLRTGAASALHGSTCSARRQASSATRSV